MATNPEPSVPTNLMADGYSQMAAMRRASTPISGRFNLPPIPQGSAPGMVYMGTEMGGVSGRPVDRFIPTGDAWSAYMGMSGEGQQRLYKAMDGITQGKWNGDLQWIQNQWSRAVGESMRQLQYNGVRMSPLEAMEAFAAQGSTGSGSSGSGGGGGGGGYSGPVTTTQFQESVNLTDPATARGLVDNALSQYLGRKASAQEQQKFMEALALKEQANPSTTSSTTVSTPSGPGRTNVRSKTQSSGGFNAQQFANEYAASQEGSAEYAAATEFLDAFISSVVNPRVSI